jgi:hypothetical protein
VSVSFVETVFGCDERCRTLENIAAFSEKRAQRSTIERAHEQSDTDEINTWEKELDMAIERLSVIQDLLLRFHTYSSSFRCMSYSTSPFMLVMCKLAPITSKPASLTFKLVSPAFGIE